MSEIRTFFTSRFGDKGVLIEGDFSQIEIVVLAYLSQDQQMMQDIKDGIDFHCKRLAFKLKEPYADVHNACHHDVDAKYVAQRKKIKQFSFQRAYGAGAPAIAEAIGLPVKEVLELIEIEETMYPEVIKLHTGWLEEVEGTRGMVPGRITPKGFPVERGFITSVTGRRYTFDTFDLSEKAKKFRGRATDFSLPQIKNYPVQGFAGEILREVLGQLVPWVLKNDLLLINTVHDSILLDVPIDRLEEAGEGLLRRMQSARKYLKARWGLNFNLPIKAEVKYGPNWASMKTLEV